MMKHFLFFLTMALLTLAACDDNDEPNGNDNTPVDVLVTITDNDQDYIYNLDGELIYQTEPNCIIRELAAEGQDWYAIVWAQRKKSYLIKNGDTIYTPTNGISSVAVSNGDIYTLEYEPQYIYVPNPSVSGYIYRIYKNGVMLYDLGLKIDDPFSNFRLRPSANGQPDVVVDYYSGSDRTPWVNGKVYALPDIGIDPDWLSCFDIENNDVQIISWEPYNETRRFKYWFNGRSGWLDENTTVKQQFLHQGKSYILCTISHYQTVKSGQRTTNQPAVYINGKLKEIDTGYNTDQSAIKMHLHGNNLYVLTNNILNYPSHSFIYKNMKQMETGSIVLPSTGAAVNMNDLIINNFVVVDKP